jgi:diacylglycerol kinase (ATP)
MVFTHEPYDAEKTEVFQTNALSIRSRRKVHFQVDGEYLGKIKEINATLIPNALHIIVPQNG